MTIKQAESLEEAKTKAKAMISSKDEEMVNLGVTMIVSMRINRELKKGEFRRMVKSQFSKSHQKMIRRKLMGNY